MARAKVNGIKKSAILLMALGPTVSANILKHFSENDIERISLEIANTTQVDVSSIEDVLDEFLLLSQAQRYMLDGGLEYAQTLLEETLGGKKAGEIIKKLREASQIKPFMFVRKADPKQLTNLISQEHPQTIALILSYLEPQQASMVISELPDEQQSEIARRIAVMDRTSPEVLKEVEGVLKERLSTVVQQDFASAGGIQALVDILNNVDRGTEKLILEELEKDDPQLVDEIRKRMFIFEDIISLDDASIQRIIREVDQKDLALALKGSSDEVRERVFKNVSKRAAEMLREDIDFMGPVRLREVEEGQQRIVSIIRKLDETGEIIISRGGEDAIIV
ncbi:flagellar motor switch protein FliG [Dethiobacter alkaliphilus]|uniref:Flagellar motor switch protein FliG n=1 Tax=Dethiobacter alkaliphilus AHT 1 TaxID=555088 RepID=C0GJI1_DETAL|nr:flagellar motor switch protein FliG [Dethiobacter alkaliphilus]EEG76528.1 flagellar motor switch protein FliG [Dethiobacter alkaliphilus AHT 1]